MADETEMLPSTARQIALLFCVPRESSRSGARKNALARSSKPARFPARAGINCRRLRR